jgi:glycosyltransferase involved in cell wall biosynthesis
MRIGIDAKWYLSGNPSGKVVVRNIVDQVISIEPNHDIFLFVQHKDITLAYELEKKCSQTRNIQIVYCISSINFLSNIFVLPWYLRKYKIDVCLFQNFTPFLFHKSIKYIAYIHDFLFFDYPQYYSKIERVVFRFMKTTSKYARKIITISNSEKRRIIKHTQRSSNEIHVAYHGISDDFSPTNFDKSIPKRFNILPKYMLYLGRINTRKNIEILLDAISKNEDLPPLVIVGKKDHKSFDIEKYIKEKDISDRIFLLGHLSYSDLLKVLGSAHVFIFPSYAEGFGLPPLEAMKSGVPVIVSNATCLPEVCGNSALYFDVNDSDKLTNHIRHLYQDESLYASQKQKGLLHVQNFNWRKTTEQILNILTE